MTLLTESPVTAAEIVEDDGEHLTLYALDLTLTQANLPFQPKAGKRLGSQRHFVVYADRITLAGALTNPGRDLHLHAREIILAAPTVLDVGGADAESDYAAGVPAIQTDTRPAAAGSHGANGTDGRAAGTLKLVAERIINRADASSALTLEDGQTRLEELLRRALAARPPAEVALPTLTFHASFLNTKIDATMQGGRARLSGWQVKGIGVDAARGQLDIALSLPALTIDGRIESQFPITGPSKPFSAEFFIRCTFPQTGRVAELAGARCAIGTVVLGRDGAIDPVSGQQLEKALREAAWSAVVLPALGNLGAEPPALTLIAQGGHGGRGQDGHAGEQGEKGENGIDTGESNTGTIYNGVPTYPAAAIGKAGKQGGKGGNPGHSGAGGPGGKIEIAVVEPPALTMRYHVAGGLGGEMASPGARGAGGRGGTGGSCILYEIDFSTNQRRRSQEQAPDGPDGPLGPEADGRGNTGDNGAAGAQPLVNGAVWRAGSLPAFDLFALAEALPLAQLLITQNVADLAYLNAHEEEDYTRARTLYSWIADLHRGYLPDAAPRASRYSVEERALRGQMAITALTELLRLAQGLDYYGHGYDWAPALTLNSLSARTTELIGLGKVIEDQYRAYLEQGANIASRLGALRKSTAEIARRRREGEAELERQDREIAELYELQKRYDADRAAVKDQLNTSSYAFRQQFEQYLIETHQTQFDEWLSIIGAVVTTAGGVIGAVGGIATAVKELKKATEFGKQAKQVVEMLKKAKGALDSIKKGYKSIKETLGEESDDGLIVVDSKEFDDFIAEYLDKIPAADELREEMLHYRRIAQARNVAACNYTARVAQRISLAAQLAQAEQEVKYIEAEAAAQQANLLPAYTAFMKSVYQRAGRNLLRKLYEEHRAYEYWALEKKPFSAGNLTMADLADAHERTLSAIDGFRADTDGFDPFTQTVVLTAEKFPAAFAELSERRALTFELDIGTTPGFDNMRAILVEKFELNFPDIGSNQGVLAVNLIHSGQSVFNRKLDLTAPDALMVFSHRPRAKLYKIDFANRANQAGGSFADESQGYVGLSPFTAWRLDFNLKGNEWVPLKSIKRVEIKFSGRFMGPGAVLRSRRAKR